MIDEKMKATKKEKTENHRIKLKNNIFSTFVLLISISIISLLAVINSLPSANALAQIEIISQNNPVEYGEAQALTLNIYSSEPNATITQALIEFEQQNHTLQKENNQYSYYWLPLQKGVYNYMVYATDSQNPNQTQVLNGTFTVIDTTPPELTSLQPEGTLTYNLIELKAVTNENSTCKYDVVDVSYDSMLFTLSGSGLIHTKLRSFGEGETQLYVRCKDDSNNIGTGKIIRFRIDTTPPNIGSIIPTGIVTQPQITLKITTDEMAICKWGRINQEYDYIENIFQSTGATLHEQPLQLSEGLNTLYVSCKDQMENKKPTMAINLELNLPPSASISIEKNSSYRALQAGTYKILLAISEPVTQTPSLKLKHSNRLINIPLEGTQQSWNGFLIFASDEGEDIGEFIFSGIDSKGTAGTDITSGKLVLIDTVKPNQPIELKLMNDNNRIRLSWDYIGEELDHYNIYRSTTGNTDKSHFKTTANDKTYFDSDVTNKIGYFYRVSAVDKAGNEGDLSEEEFLMTEYQNQTSQFQQEPQILARINEKIIELEKITQGMDVTIARLESTTDESLLEIINEQSIVANQKEVKGKIQSLIGELKTYRETKITFEDMISKVQVIDAKLKSYKAEIITNIELENKIQKEQLSDVSLVQEAINEYLKNKALTESQKIAYYEKTSALQQQVRMTQEIMRYSIEYQEVEPVHKVTIKEKFITPSEISGITVQEVVPAGLIKTSEINFINPPVDFNQMGILWSWNDLTNREIKYEVNYEGDLNQLQNIRTVLLYNVEDFLRLLSSEPSTTTQGNANQGQATGLSIFSGLAGNWVQNIFLPIALIIIAGLLVYYLFFLKTGSLEYSGEQKSVHVSRSFIAGQKDYAHPEAGLKFDSSVLLLVIQEAYEAIENRDLELATQKYSLALSQYSRVNLSIKDRLKINFEMNTLHDNILNSLEMQKKDLMNS
ncbi:hypothetical protein JW756_05645 [Candidatus Woesearchaeota archaeon]|nr:hypothetical protein [Candidatus Woesearchaeota archaeon]